MASPGGSPDFKWQGWSNGGGGGGNKTPKNPWTKNWLPKKPMPDFWAWKISKKQLNDKTQQVWLYVILRTMDTWANKPQIFFF